MNVAVEAAPKTEVQANSGATFDVGQPFVHMHIPKTAGTALRRMFEDEFGQENVYLFHHETGRLLRSDQRQLAIPNRYLRPYQYARKTAEKLGVISLASSYVSKKRMREAHSVGRDTDTVDSLGFSVVSGHLSGDALETKGLDNYPTVTVVREPLERAVSFYKHWRRTGGGLFSDVLNERDPKTTSFEEVMLEAEHCNPQSRWIGHATLERIGVVEHLNGFLESIGMVEAAKDVLVANQDPTPEKRPTIDRGFLREFEAANAADYELYYQTLDTWS